MATGAQVIVVSASGYGTTLATLRAYSGSRLVFGPWTAHIGRTGFAAPGTKREGDGHTPSGSFGISFAFGVAANPGVRLPYRIAGVNDVWDDDPASPRYNEWVDRTQADPGVAPERLRALPAYRYAAVIAYNSSRTPGLGSAIFLHVTTGGATAGCVSLPLTELLQLLRWFDPAASPRIVMGVDATR
jgi:L,D-peptidoglycan transpeptidase YkuD (ErfK/YbiS/YcfS/YnhG family)